MLHQPFHHMARPELLIFVDALQPHSFYPVRMKGDILKAAIQGFEGAKLIPYTCLAVINHIGKTLPS